MTIKLDQHGQPVQAARPALVQNVAFSGTSAQSAAFQTGPTTPLVPSDGSSWVVPNNTTHIRVVSNAACWIAFGSNPTAAVATGAILIPAYTPEYFWVVRGEKLAVIQDSASGSLNIAELAQ